MNTIINILASRVALATALESENIGELAFGLTKEGLTVVSIALIAMLVAAFLAGRASKRTVTSNEKSESHAANAVTSPSNTDDKQLVAVITAVIMAMRDEEARANGTEAVGFRVVSFKRSERR